MIPVGPGHERFSVDAVRSVWRAWGSPGSFTDLEIAVVGDARGERGRSASRNVGVREHPGDWYFFLDADDRMLPGAFERVELGASATFGAVCLDGKVSKDNVYPLTREGLFVHGAKGTLSMGCFVRGDVARETPFDETMDVGEDFDFYLRLPGFVKVREPLVSIGYRLPSAGGPRGYETVRWVEACRKVIDGYR